MLLCAAFVLHSTLCDACTAADFLKLPNAMFHNGAMRVNNSHAETRNMIETLQAAYAKLGPFRHNAQVFHQAAETDTRTAVSLETDFFAPDDTALGKAKCEFWVEQTTLGPKIAMLEIVASLLPTDVIEDKLFGAHGEPGQAALD